MTRHKRAERTSSNSDSATVNGGGAVVGAEQVQRCEDAPAWSGALALSVALSLSLFGRYVQRQ